MGCPHIWSSGQLHQGCRAPIDRHRVGARTGKDAAVYGTVGAAPMIAESAGVGAMPGPWQVPLSSTGARASTAVSGRGHCTALTPRTTPMPLEDSLWCLCRHRSRCQPRRQHPRTLRHQQGRSPRGATTSASEQPPRRACGFHRSVFRSRRWAERAFFDTGGIAHRHATVERL